MVTRTTIGFSLKTASLVLSCVFILFSFPAIDATEFSESTLTLSAPGVALETPSTLLVAVRLNNTGEKTALDVQIEQIQLELATRVLPVRFPLILGDIAPDKSGILEANFKSDHLIPRKNYLLVVRGKYLTTNKEDDKDQDRHGSHDRGKKEKHEFTARIKITLPPAAPGSALLLHTGALAPLKVSGGPFPEQPPSFEQHVNEARWTVPTGSFSPGIPTQFGTSAEKAPIGDPNNVSFLVNNHLGFNMGMGGNVGDNAEPSGASGGGVVFITANAGVAYSTDGGNTFTYLNPATMFPNDAVGFCCDQIVQYVPSIDRFIWLLQGKDFDGVRIAFARPVDVINSKGLANPGAAWSYLKLTPDVFGYPNGTGFDYPDLSVGTNYLYMSWDVLAPDNCPADCISGFQVARMALGEIQAGGTIGKIDYTNPADSAMASLSHLSQNTGDEIFWAGHNSNHNMRVFFWPENEDKTQICKVPPGSGYSWCDIEISSWANTALSSTTPDGKNWLSYWSDSHPVIGATRSSENESDEVWFAWSAGIDSNFHQPHVELVTLDRANDFNLIQQVQIWNNNYAFAFPALATNACTGEIGLSLEYGGNGNYENHVVGFWGDFLVYITTNSNLGTGRFGDYVTIRQNPDPRLNGEFFDAFGYGLNRPPPPVFAERPDVRYVVFGRGGACTLIP